MAGEDRRTLVHNDYRSSGPVWGMDDGRSNVEGMSIGLAIGVAIGAALSIGDADDRPGTSGPGAARPRRMSTNGGRREGTTESMSG